MRILDLAIAAGGATLIGVALWVFVLGGPSGDSQPPASQTEPTVTSMATAPLPTETQEVAASLEEQPTPPPPPVAPSKQEPSPPPESVDEQSQPPPSNVVAPPPPPPATMAPPAPTPTPLPPLEPPPSDDDLYFEFTRLGMTTGAYFYVYVLNRNLFWSVCDLVLHVEYDYERLDRNILRGSTEPETVSYLAPLEEREVHLIGIEGYYTFRFVDYWIVADWVWC